jgi:CheY-like chemotaxis protein
MRKIGEAAGHASGSRRVRMKTKLADPGTVEPSPAPPAPSILLVEDNEEDIFLFRRALSKLGFAGRVHVVPLSWDARDYLEGRDRYRDRAYYPPPDLIVSDLHLRGADGLALVGWVRERNHLLPIVVLSGAIRPSEADELTQAGVTAFYGKSADFEVTCVTVADILKRLPPKS